MDLTSTSDGAHLSAEHGMTGRMHLHPAAVQALGKVTEEVSRSESVKAILLFGSQARGTATPTSDIDVIYLLESARSARKMLYTKMRVNGFDFDMNLVSTSDVSRLVALPSWQYRFMDARLFSINDEFKTAATDWLKQLQAWGGSAIARDYRIAFCRDRVRRLVQRAMEVGNGNPGVRAFYHALALERSLFLMCELAGEVPFSKLNPLETLSALVKANDIPAGWPLHLGRIGSDQVTRADSWTTLKTAVQDSMMAIPEFVNAASDGGDSADVALALPLSSLNSKTLWRSFCNQGWSEKSALIWISRASALSGNKAAMQQSDLTLGKVIDRIPSSRERRIAQRYEEYDPLRRRLKVIIPTGGCRLPRCTFCRLPELASRAIELELETVISERGEGLREVAIYTDGSFFDDREVSDETRLRIADRLRGLEVTSAVVESLPQLATLDKVARFIDRLGDKVRLTVSVGVQTTDHALRRVVLGTPTTEAAIDRFFTLRPRLGFSIRVFLLYGKPMLTIDEDESDVTRSVRDLSEKLGIGDTVSVNYLNVVRGTQVDRLERAGLYRRKDICRFRMFVQDLVAQGQRFRIAPGCIAVRTCSERDLADGRVCPNCLDWLKMAESGRAPGGRPCSEQPGFNFELPWPVFGGVEDRCKFVSLVFGQDRASISDVPVCVGGSDDSYGLGDIDCRRS